MKQLHLLIPTQKIKPDLNLAVIGVVIGGTAGVIFFVLTGIPIFFGITILSLWLGLEVESLLEYYWKSEGTRQRSGQTLIVSLVTMIIMLLLLSPLLDQAVAFTAAFILIFIALLPKYFVLNKNRPES